jgi:hypothetical protein
MMRWRQPFHLLIAAVLLTATSCEIEFTEQEVRIRHDAAADQLHVLLIYKGLTAPEESENAVKKAVQAMEKLLAGRRQFMVVNWPLHFDLDSSSEKLRNVVEEWQAASEEQRDEDGLQHFQRAQETLAVLRNFHVTEYGLMLDEEERLSGYQYLRIDRISALIAHLNESLRREILENFPDESDDDLDLRTQRLMLQKAKERSDWIWLKDGVFGAEVPTSHDALAGLFREFGKDLRKAEEKDLGFLQVLGTLLHNVQEFHIAHERLTITLGNPETRLLKAKLEVPSVEYRADLRKALQKLGIEPNPQLTLDSVRSKLEE